MENEPTSEASEVAVPPTPPAPTPEVVQSPGAAPVEAPRTRTWLRPVVWGVLLVAIAVYVAVVGAYVVLDHQAFNTQTFDLGIFDQALYLVSHGETPFITVRGLHRFGDHIELILYPLAPLYWLWNDVRAALLFQTFVIALGAMGVFLLARTRLGQVGALCFALAYLLNPSVQNLNLDNVHAEAFGATALLFAFYFGSRGRFVPMLLLCALAMSCKEDVAITTGVFGLYVAWRWNRRVGLGLLAVSIVWFLLCMKVLLPAFNDSGFFRFKGGGWFSGWYANMFVATWYVKTIVHPEVGRYLLNLLAPLAFLPLLSPATALIAAPAMLINILSGTGYLRSIDYHYMTSITPFLFAAAVEGAAKVSSWKAVLAVPFVGFRRYGRTILLRPGLRLMGPALPAWVSRVAVLVIVLAAAILANLALSHLPANKAAGKIRELSDRVAKDERLAAIREAIDMIPPDASVSAEYHIATHMTHRRNIYMYPNPFSPDCWGIQGENLPDPNTVQYLLVTDGDLSGRKAQVLNTDLVATGQMKRIFSRAGVHVYVRKAQAARAFAERPAAGEGLMGAFFQFHDALQTLPEWQGRTPAVEALFPKIFFPVNWSEFVSTDGIRTGMTRFFMAVFDGYLIVPESGAYQFTVSSDDGFRLIIDGKTVGEVNRLHAYEGTSMNVTLQRGIVPIRLLYFENEPPHGLELRWRVPGSAASAVIPPSALAPSREAAEQRAGNRQP